MLISIRTCPSPWPHPSPPPHSLCHAAEPEQPQGTASGTYSRWAVQPGPVGVHPRIPSGAGCMAQHFVPLPQEPRTLGQVTPAQLHEDVVSTFGLLPQLHRNSTAPCEYTLVIHECWLGVCECTLGVWECTLGVWECTLGV